jgi:hypothetical protein
VADSAGTGGRDRPATSASSPSPPIAAARRTLGDGRARITKPTRATAHAAPASRGPARHHRATSSTAPTTIATFAPETAHRWVIPVARKSSATAGSRREVSPSTRPGSSPPGPDGSDAHARRSPSRSPPAARCAHGARPTCSGAAGTDSTAAVRSPPPGAVSRPEVTTGVPGSRARQAGSFASTSSRAWSSTRDPSGRSSVPAEAGTAYAVGRFATPRTGFGSSTMVSPMWTVARSWARPDSGCDSRVATLAAVAAAPQTAPSSTASSTRRTSVARCACRVAARRPASQASPAVPAATATVATPAGAGRYRQASAAAHAPAAADASRRSGNSATGLTPSPGP